MPIYDKNHKLLGVTYEGRLFYPNMFGGYWKQVQYYTVLAKNYFD